MERVHFTLHTRPARLAERAVPAPRARSVHRRGRLVPPSRLVTRRKGTQVEAAADRRFLRRPGHRRSRLQSPVATLTGSYFEAHVIQHLLLMIIAPALLAMGAPMTLILQTSSRRAKTMWLRILHSKVFAVLSHPLVVWFLYYGAMLAFFLTPLIGFAMEHMWLMDLINLGFLLGGTLFWWPMIGLDPIPRWSVNYPLRIVNLLIGVPLESFLAIALLGSHQTIAPMYSLQSSHSGAGVLWVLSELLTVAAVIPIYFQWMAAEDRKTAREDARLDAEEAQWSPVASAVTRRPPEARASSWTDFRPNTR